MTRRRSFHTHDIPRVAVSVALFFGTLAGDAYACSCSMEGTVDEKVQKAGAVFQGRVMRATAKRTNDPYVSYTIYEFEVTASWKGVKRKKVKLWEYDDMCAQRFLIWEEYIVYAGAWKGRLWTSGCEYNVRLMSPEGGIAEKAVTEMKELSAPIWEPEK